MIYVIFIILAGIIVYTANKLSLNAMIIEENSKLNAAVVGIILALATSLPELATGITSTLIGQSEMAISNVLGSNAFNVTILAVVNIFFFKKVVYSKVNQQTNKINYFSMLMYLTVLAAFLIFPSEVLNLGFLSISTILIIFLYYVSVKVLNTDEEQEVVVQSNYDSTLLKKAVTNFSIFALIVLVASVSLSLVADVIVDKSGLDASFVGAIFIGVSTSLPEFTSAITLVRNSSYNLAASSVLGSNSFNFIILFVVDLFDREPLLYTESFGTIQLVYLGMFFTFLTMIAIDFKIKNKYLNLIIPFIILCSYSLYIILGAQ